MDRPQELTGRGAGARLERWGGSVLLGVLLVSLLMLPVADRAVFGVHLARAAMAAVLLAALGALRVYRFGVVLILAALAADLVEDVSPWPWWFVVSHGLRVLGLAYVAVIVLWDTMRQQRVTPHTIAGAASVYLLIGFLWAQLYALLDKFDPGAFSAPPHWLPAGPHASVRFTYFSFVTLATLGYGDIVPAGPAAASLTLLEALLGQLYLVTLIARLVGLHTAQSRG